MSLLARAARVSPFGPIFGKELRVTSRRKRTYLLRMGYLGLLLLALLLAYATTGRSYGGVAAQMQRQAALGTAFFAAFTVFTVGSMGLMGPVLTANAIGAEKLAKTLPVLLMTPISAWQVVSGKLFSRVLIALMLLGLSMPVLALCRLLGGVELDQMLAVLLIAISHVISCAAIGLFFSLFLNRAAVVILLSYAVMGLFYVLLPIMLIVLADVGQGGPRGGTTGIQFIVSINPFGCAMAMMEPRARGFIGNAWIVCVGIQLAIAALLVGWSAIILRRQFRSAGERAIALPPIDASAGYVPVPGFVAAPPPLPESFAAEGNGTVQPIAPPAIDDRMPRTPAKKHATRDVSDNPVLWRELRRPLLPKTWQRAVGVSSVIVILLIIYAIQADDNDLDDIDAHIGYACVFFGLWWVLAAVLSATAISQEKESDTWTLLLTTPMSGRQIVWGKVAGLLRRMIWPTVLVAAHFLLFVVGGVLPFWSVIFVLFMLLACNSVWIATGVWLSLRIKKVTFAVVANLMLAIVAYGVVPLMVLIPAELLTRRGDRIAEHTGWYIPYVYLAQGFEGMRRAENFERYPSNNYNYYNNNSWSRGPYWLPGGNTNAATFLTYAFVCSVAHLALALLILHRTATTFDEIVGRAGRRQFVGIADTDDAVLPVIQPPPEAGVQQSASPQEDRPVNLAADQYASPGRRLIAWAVDFTIVQFCCGVVGLVWGVINVLNESLDDTSETMMIEQLRNYFAISMAAGLFFGWFYWAINESSRRRATPGKTLMGIFVTDLQGRRISFGRATLRYWSKFISILPAGLGLFTSLVSRRNQTMHDEIGKTLVLRK